MEKQEVFEKVILPFGEEHGLSATYEEFTAYVKTLSEYDQAELFEDELTQVAGGKVNAGGAGSLSCEKYGIGFGFIYGSDGGGFCLIIGGGPADKRYDAICVTVGSSDI